MHQLDTERPRALLIAFCLLLWLPGLFTLPATDRDESRFAQASKQMLETGDYIHIMNGREPRNRKPIGIYWMQAPFAAAARALHLTDENPIWPYRLPSVAGGLLAVLVTYEAGRSVDRSLNGRRAALLAAGMLAASVILVTEIHLAKTDAALLGATTVAMAVLGQAYLGQPIGRGRAAVFWVAMAVGVLLKGPITPMVAGLAVAALVVADRRARWLLALRPALGALLMLAMVLPWFVTIGLATHGAFFADAVGGDLGRKLVGGDNAHGAPPGLHLLMLPVLAFPATLPVLAGLPGCWRRRQEPAIRFLLAWAAPAWLVFEIAPTKLPHYTLPLYPALFLLAAWLWTGVPLGWWSRWAAPGLTAAAALALAIMPAALPSFVLASPLLGVPTFLAAGVVGWLALQPRRPAVALAAMPLFTAALVGWELPQARPLWIAPQIEHELEAAGLADEPMASAGFREPSLMFLAGTATIMCHYGADAAAALASGRAASAAVSESDEASFQGAAEKLGLQPRAIATLHGFNYSRGQKTNLTLYELTRTAELGYAGSSPPLR